MSVLVNAYSTLRHLPPIDFSHELHGHRTRDDSALAEHLQGFIGYVMPADPGGMTQIRYHIYRHLQRVRHHLSLTIADEQLDDLADWAERANAILFLPDGTVCSPIGEVLFDPEATDTPVDRDVPYPENAHRRRARTQALLRQKDIPVMDALPPVVSDEEVECQSAADVARRIFALTVVAVTAESRSSDQPIPAARFREKCPLGVAALSPVEQEFFESESAPLQAVVDHAWRYEALFILEWALGLIETLPFPDAICDVPLASRLAFENNNPEFIAAARLRPLADILDALDLHYCLHWAARSQREDPEALADKLDLGVVRERHHALNWLVRFEDAPWDEVDTPT